jgi:hypothetical protein
MELITGKIKDIIQQHDSVRILQCCIQYGTDENRQTIFSEMERRWTCSSPSANKIFFVGCFVQHSTKAVYKNDRSLLRNCLVPTTLCLGYSAILRPLHTIIRSHR